ncbi:unnamed protein product [Cuscuta campestris]|uniref:Uncharacterized protein n=1 Tax=Cuscuta campestris TaxID=132261 RepID=A0A484KPP6_9ASTE|nr:unnamed protein product [Cuscuta campestris]
MESDYFLYDSIILEAEFQDIGFEDEVIHLSSTSDAKEEDEVIVIHSDDDDADVAPVRGKNMVIVLEFEEDSLIGSEEDGSFEDVEGSVDVFWIKARSMLKEFGSVPALASLSFPICGSL